MPVYKSFLSSPTTLREEGFTPRAVITGLCIGLLLVISNTYFGLAVGWISMMSLQSALLGFAIFKVLPNFGGRALSVNENILIQTTAVATGTMPLAAGLVGIIPALAMLKPEEGGSIILSPTSLIAWCVAVCFFGVFLAVPLRKQVIVKEKLVFPSGTATGRMIAVLHKVQQPADSASSIQRADGYEPIPSSEQEEVAKPKMPSKATSWTTLAWSFGASAFYTLVTYAIPVLYTIPIFDILPINAAHDWLWWFTPSPSYVGQGIIMGFQTTAAMNLGMICGWAIVSPLAKHFDWASGPANGPEGIRAYILWPALAIMTAEALTSLSSVTYSILQTAWSSCRTADAQDSDSDHDWDDRDQDLPMKYVVAGLALSCLLCIGLVHAVFGQGIKWWATIVALLLASILSVLGVRSLGETDLNPVSSIGKISQLVFAIIQPGSIVANLVAGGISEAGAQQAGDLMQDYKTGHLLGASPRVQLYGQLIGSITSAIVSSLVYLLYSRVYTLPSTQFPVPSAAIWLNLARLLNGGHLPPHSWSVMGIFGMTFFVSSSTKAIAAFRKRGDMAWARYIPSGIAFAIGCINTPSFSIARFIGGLISLYRVRQRKVQGLSSNFLEDVPLIVVASGFVLGEGLASIVNLCLKSAGVEPLTCMGCQIGGGGYCGNC